MTKVLDYLEAKRTGAISLSDFQQRPILKMEGVRENYDCKIPDMSEYILVGRVGTLFRVRGDASLEHIEMRTREARTLLSREIFKDVHIGLSRVENAINNGDAGEAIRRLNDIRRDIE